jgi:hypothetical protein
LQKLVVGDANDKQGLSRDFQAFVGQTSAAPRTAAERDALFREFLQWRERQAAPTR